MTRPPTRQTIFLGDQLAASFERPPSWETAEGGWLWARSSAYICPICLAMWAVSVVESEPRYLIISQACQAHGGGSLFPNWGVGRLHDEPLLYLLPRSLLLREFNLLSKELSDD